MQFQRKIHISSILNSKNSVFHLCLNSFPNVEVKILAFVNFLLSKKIKCRSEKQLDTSLACSDENKELNFNNYECSNRHDVWVL